MQVKHSKLSRKAATIKGLLITAFAGMAVCAVSNQVGALSFQSSFDVKFTFNPSLIVSLSSADLVINDLTPGNSADSNEITVTVGTNTAYGYSLQATAGNSSYAGSTNFNANDLVLTNGAAVSSSETNKFTSLATNASVASMSSANPDTWGYAYATYDTTNSTWNSYSNYSGLPVYTETNGAELINSDGVADSKSIKFKIAANASTSQVAGEYTNVVNFIAVANPEPPKDISTATTMQEVALKTDGGCPATLTTGQVYELTDSRDGTTYHVARLDDGNCWLLDNLALDLTNSTVLNGMNANNTNASNATLGYLKGSTTRDPANDANGQYATSAVSDWSTNPTYGSSYSYSDPLVDLTDKDTVPSDATSTAGGYKVGGYYNYCAASAGSYCYGNGTSEGTSSGNATEDICPKNWRMPTGNTGGEYATLYSNSSYNTAATLRSALRLPLSGDFSYGSASGRGNNSYFWSSTRSSSNYMYYINVTTYNVYPSGSYLRYYGYSVRCVLGS